MSNHRGSILVYPSGEGSQSSRGPVLGKRQGAMTNQAFIFYRILFDTLSMNNRAKFGCCSTH